MTTYRVGPEGATVFTEGGKPLYKLTPGLVVVAGYSDLKGSLAAQHADNVEAARRRAGYDDKVIRPARTSPTPPRQADRRLRNPQAGSG